MKLGFGLYRHVFLSHVSGKVPRYREMFIDECDLDVRRILQILHRNKFDGVIIPDHAPQMTCAAPWHAGMAFAMGYPKATMEEVVSGC